MALATVTLAMAPGPGFPHGSPDHRYVVHLRLDAEARLDVAAWVADPAPWPAERARPGAPPQGGDVQYEPEAGWALRFFTGSDDSPDVPSVMMVPQDGRIRPGSYIRLFDPCDVPRDYRVVGVQL